MISSLGATFHYSFLSASTWRRSRYSCADKRLRAGLDEADIERTREVLARLQANISDD